MLLRKSSLLVALICSLAFFSCAKKDLDAEKAGEKVGAAASKFLRGVGKAVTAEGEKTGEALGAGAAKLATGAGKGVAQHGEKAGEALGAGTGALVKGAAKGMEKVLGADARPK